MPGALGLLETMYKVKQEENLFFGEIWLPPQNAGTRVRLLYKYQENNSPKFNWQIMKIEKD